MKRKKARLTAFVDMETRSTTPADMNSLPETYYEILYRGEVIAKGHMTAVRLSSGDTLVRHIPSLNKTA